MPAIDLAVHRVSDQERNLMLHETDTALTRRRFLQLSSAAALAAACAPGLCEVTAPLRRKPNIVLILADDLGYECLGANGGTSYKTPALDALAAGGVRFEHCYSQPLCTPSRVQLMTGIYNVRNYVDFGYMDPGATTMAQLLRKAGYVTCIAGKWQLAGGYDLPGRFGFDDYCLWQLNRRPSRYWAPGLEIGGRQVDHGPDMYGPDIVNEHARGFIERNKDRPFFLYYPMMLTHDPFTPTPDSAGDRKSAKSDPRYFGDMVAYMDKLIGKLVAKLEEAGVRKDTLILFTGDNGTGHPIVSMMGDRKVAGGKGSITDGGTRVPLVANWPTAIPAGRTSDDLVDFTDFLPTLCDAGGIAVPPELKIDGRSFLPQLRGEKGNPHDWVYCWFSRNGRAAGAKEFARTRRYKLYRNGNYVDIKKDPLEKHALAEAEIDAAALAEKKLLQGVLDRYANSRPAHLLNRKLSANPD